MVNLGFRRLRANNGVKGIVDYDQVDDLTGLGRFFELSEIEEAVP